MDWYLMVWRKYAEFDGRARRTEYWMFALINTLALLALGAVGAIGIAMSQDYGGVLFIPLGIYALAAIIPSLSVAVRRFHDTGKSGWILLLLIVLGIIPIVGFITSILQLVFLCIDSDPGPNQYGPNPKFPEQAAGMFAGSAGFAQMGLGAQPQPLTGANSFSPCKGCGALLPLGSSFCTRCGTRA
jgi:uncharacterized membrane protein YhaH (DUF805 family)